MTPAEALAHPESLATTLLVALLDLVLVDAEDGWSEDEGPLSWTVETWRREVQDRAGVTLTREALARLEAARVVLTTDRFTHEVPTFVEVALALDGIVPDPDEYSPADARQCAWAIGEAALLDTPDDLETWLAEDVRRYIGYVLVEDGLTIPFGPLDGVAILPRSRDWSGRPEAAQIQAEQEDRARALTAEFQARLELLASQLASLELRHGDTVAFAQRLQGA